MKKIDVVGAVIYNNKSKKYLVTMRDKDRHMGGLWEFPGGKIEEGESPEAALVREINEELNCKIKVERLLLDYTHTYEEIMVRLITYLCTLEEGEPQAIEHEAIKWSSSEDLLKLKWAPADIPTVKMITKEI